MEIKKILIVESCVHLYHILDNHKDELELLDGESLLRVEYYQSLASEYLYGCKCEEDSNWARLSAEYDSIKADEDLILSICSVLGCYRVDFSE